MKLKMFLSCVSLIYMGALGADWTPATQITAGAVNFDVTSIYDPDSATLTALWVSVPDSGAPVASVSTDHGANWQPTVLLNNVPVDSANIYTAYNAAHQNKRKKLVAAWGPGAPPVPVTTAVSTDGGKSWGNIESISGTFVRYEVFVVYDANNNSIIATWEERSTHLPTAAISTDGGTTWGAPIDIATTNQANGNIHTVYNPTSRNIIATWLNSTSHIPFSATSTNGGKTWSAIPIQMGSSGGVFDAPLTYNPVFNNIVSTWVDSVTNLPMAAISTNDGATWSSPVVISDSVTGFQDVYTAVDPVTGIVFAAWTGGANTLPYYSTSNDGGNTWSPALQISATVLSEDFVFLTFDPVSRSFLATWTNPVDLSPQFSLYALSSAKDVACE
jgi:hypothetical protein